MSRLATHHDADGLSSAVLFKHAFGGKVKDVHFPKTFGDVGSECDICLDMTPLNANWEGKVVDHHDQHPEEHKYELYFGHKPTSLLVLEKLEDKIPKEYYWKAAIGAVGDMQPEKIPNVIWKMNPGLLDTIRYTDRWNNNIKEFKIQKYKMLSSGVNALCKIGEEEKAFTILFNADEPDDILENHYLKNAKDVKKKEVNKVFNDNEILDLGQFMYMEYESDLKISGEIAARLEDMSEKTSVAYNRKKDKGSMRGVLTDLVLEEMDGVENIESGGHQIAAGFGNAFGVNMKELLRNII